MLLYVQKKNFLRREIRKRNIPFSWVQTTGSSKSNQNNKKAPHTLSMTIPSGAQNIKPLQERGKQKQSAQAPFFLSLEDLKCRDRRSNKVSPKAYATLHFILSFLGLLKTLARCKQRQLKHGLCC